MQQTKVHTAGKERRRRRSSDPQQALSLQLSHVRSEAHLDAVVLANEDGLPIAHSCDAALCSELAALAPLLSKGKAAANQVEIRQDLLFVRTVNFEGSNLYVASCVDSPKSDNPSDVDRWLVEATRGVKRILAA